MKHCESLTFITTVPGSYESLKSEVSLGYRAFGGLCQPLDVRATPCTGRTRAGARQHTTSAGGAPEPRAAARALTLGGRLEPERPDQSGSGGPEQ